MALQISLSILLVLSASLALLLAFYALRHLNRPGALSLALILIGQALWAMLGFSSLHTDQLARKLVLDALIISAADLSVTGSLLFALAYTGRVRLTCRIGPLLFGYALLSALAIWTDPWHHLMRLDPTVVTDGPVPLLNYRDGPLMQLNLLIDHSLVLLALLILARSAIQATRPSQQQAWILVIGLAMPLGLSLLTVAVPRIFVNIPDSIIVPISFLLVYPLLAWSLFARRILDVLPLQHDLLIEKLPDGVLLIDQQGQIAAANATAQHQLGHRGLGQPLTALLPELAGTLNQRGEHIGQIKRATITGTLLYLDTRMTPLQDRWGRSGGWLLVLRDITTQQLAETELREREAAYRTLAFEHARLYEEARKQSAQAETLRQAAAVIAGTLDVQEAITRIMDQLALVVPHDSASVQLRRGAYSEIFGCRGFPDPQKIIGLRFCIQDNPLCKTIYEHGKMIVLPTIEPHHGFEHQPGQTIRSWMGLPLLVGDQVIGLLALDSHTPNHFTDDHIRVVTAFATHVALALDHSQLYWDAVQARERLLQLQQAARLITAHSTITVGLYAAAYEATAQLMPTDNFTIILLDPDQQPHLVYQVPPASQACPKNVCSHIQALVAALIAQPQPHFLNGSEICQCGQDLASPPLHSGLAVGLRDHSTLQGILLTQSHLPDAYQNDDATLLELLAAHIATALKTSTIFSEVERLATTDGLTGLFNRRQFFSLAEQALRRVQIQERPISAMLLDLDHFKQINDQYGHQAGDEVLRAVATACRNCLRDHDLIGRYGGEEFAFLLPGANHSEALKIGERIKQAVDNLIIPNQDAIIRITASIGVATDVPTIYGNLDQLLARADGALYQAKYAGRNRVISEQVVSLPTTIRD